MNFLLQSCFSKLEPNFFMQLCNKKLRSVQLCFSSNFFPIRTDGSEKKLGGQFCIPVFSLDKDGPKELKCRIDKIDVLALCITKSRIGIWVEENPGPSWNIFKGFPIFQSILKGKDTRNNLFLFFYAGPVLLVVKVNSSPIRYGVLSTSLSHRFECLARFPFVSRKSWSCHGLLVIVIYAVKRYWSTTVVMSNQLGPKWTHFVSSSPWWRFH